ncbi:Uncharacterized protein FWK35_00009900 [Aphis craccivora]|uniref:Uncharacterized protein n=1 Tax=Aphis craccivora TaxID=307492 RepID=A0A6G0YA32_APHCR|nr:Uncharacterized protein FWK35_00009900 [Aphis craccivora]
MRRAQPPGKDNRPAAQPAAANDPAHWAAEEGVSHLVSFGIRGAAWGTSSKLRWRVNASVSEQTQYNQKKKN